MKINKLGIALIVTAILSVTMITCVNQEVEYQQDARLLTLTIGGVEVPTIPRPISESQWNSETFGLAGADFGRASFNNTAAITEKRIVATVNAGSRAEWGIATRGTKPGFWTDMRVPATFSDQDYIYIKVNSNDNKTTSYYRVYTRLKAYVTDLNQISIQERVGKAATDEKGDALPGEPSWDSPELEASLISVTKQESESAFIEAVTFDPNATVKYAFVAKDATDDPVFTAPDVALPLADEGNLYVEVTAENTIDTAYFKFKVEAGRMATIKTLKFTGGPKGEKEVFGKGLPTRTWSSVTAGAFSTAKKDQPVGGFNVLIEADDPDADVSYVLYRKEDSGTPAFGANNPNKVEFVTDDSLAIKVESVTGGNVNYYRIRVTLQAANITKQPKSTWYYKGDTAEPLSIELDPPDTGNNYTYQWYQADSWYGIYGRHGVGIDEKGNVSCVNGGPGQYFYLVQPDEIPTGGPENKPWAEQPLAWSMPGETKKTYTPSTNWVNVKVPDTPINTKPLYPNGSADASSYNPGSPQTYFLQGGTSETRYYWVKVTDKESGLTVVSDRAVILTETDRTMEHFVFDLSLIERKNLVPFTKKGEVYQADLSKYPFPSNFDPSKYQICIAHAQYFLPDGRPWTQNWTHGDLHFGYTQGSDSYKKNGGPLTWWHNNLGANSGSIPLQAPHASKGGLEYKPDWIGFAPSGDPEKGLPRPDPNTGELPKGIYSMSADDPYPAGVAQGYFAGFIELLEVHFSTAPQR
jgi:hypothetical protein